MERDAARKKELGTSVPVTPVTPKALEMLEHAQSSVPASQPVDGPEATAGASSRSREISQIPQTFPHDLLPDGQILSTESQMDIPRQSIEVSRTLALCTIVS